MILVVGPHSGAVLEGDRSELETFRDAIEEALEDGEARAAVLNDVGVTPLIIRLQPA